MPLRFYEEIQDLSIMSKELAKDEQDFNKKEMYLEISRLLFKLAMTAAELEGVKLDDKDIRIHGHK